MRTRLEAWVKKTKDKKVKSGDTNAEKEKENAEKLSILLKTLERADVRHSFHLRLRLSPTNGEKKG